MFEFEFTDQDKENQVRSISEDIYDDRKSLADTMTILVRDFRAKYPNSHVSIRGDNSGVSVSITI